MTNDIIVFNCVFLYADIRGVLTTLALILQRGTTGHPGILDSIPRLQMVALAHNITLLVASEIFSLETRQVGMLGLPLLQLAQSQC